MSPNGAELPLQKALKEDRGLARTPSYSSRPTTSSSSSTPDRPTTTSSCDELAMISSAARRTQSTGPLEFTRSRPPILPALPAVSTHSGVEDSHRRAVSSACDQLILSPETIQRQDAVSPAAGSSRSSLQMVPPPPPLPSAASGRAASPQTFHDGPGPSEHLQSRAIVPPLPHRSLPRPGLVGHTMTTHSCDVAAKAPLAASVSTKPPVLPAPPPLPPLPRKQLEGSDGFKSMPQPPPLPPLPWTKMEGEGGLGSLPNGPSALDRSISASRIATLVAEEGHLPMKLEVGGYRCVATPPPLDGGRLSKKSSLSDASGYSRDAASEEGREATVDDSAKGSAACAPTPEKVNLEHTGFSELAIAMVELGENIL